MQDLKIIFAILSILIGTLGFLPYVKDILLGRTKPHSYTWLIWTITQGIAVAGLWYGNGNLGSIELTIGTILVFLVFLLSLKKGTSNITRNDTATLTIALLAVIVWWQMNNPLLAIIMVSGIDAFGFIPTLRKSWQEPWSETVLTWTLFSVGNIFAILALSSYNFFTLTYLVTITIFNIAIISICLIRRKQINPPYQ